MIISCSTCQRKNKNACGINIGFTLFCRVFKLVLIYVFSAKSVFPIFESSQKNVFFPSLMKTIGVKIWRTVQMRNERTGKLEDLRTEDLKNWRTGGLENWMP